VALTAEIADGWLPMFFSPKSDDFYRAALAERFRRPGARRTLDDFEIPAFIPVIPHDNVEEAADFMRPSLALYHRRHGHKTMNFHAQLFAGWVYEAEVEKIQELIWMVIKLTRSPPSRLHWWRTSGSFGSAAKIKDELQLWESTVLTTFLIQSAPQLLPTIADIFS